MFKSILLVFGTIVVSLFVLGCLVLFVLYICFNGSGLDNNGSTNWRSKDKLGDNVEIDKDAIELFKKGILK